MLYSFQGFEDGKEPTGTLVPDAAGNLYGTTLYGGIGDLRYGTVFEPSPPAVAGGSWTKAVLYAFKGGGDGAYPNGSLIFDKLGNLYGTTSGGGTTPGSSIFELKPPSTPGGAWTKVTLWNFNGSNGSSPEGKVVLDAAGNLYGTTFQGGSHNFGVVFELVAPTTVGARWKERILHNFGAFAGDGTFGGDDLLLRGGVLYGTTKEGDSANMGTVFRLAPKPGLWTETILHSFSGSDGSFPVGG
ncbi:MAG TPA: choice-of-anchor tandem repeat GloVer-containing protein [Candidatus Sulfotelmatobacter sp.]|nr:choice-of-anchor tandem repeat GloVer-containing protein [Candidatus Sulfotelmatobacter sp.]